ncbi:MAG: sugar phosphate isomerase/epimerase [Dehalococcoidia bacterium]|jgi:sugar phosphate isomerase/epimerase|nr:sugar phosphate isomerase/epimerase [Dehalococcoidia bacterium]
MAFYTAQEIRHRLSISTLVFRQYRPISESTLAELAAYGITKIELLESPEQFDLTDPGSMRHVARICRNAGVVIGAYHAHKTNFDDVDTKEKRRERIDLCRRQIGTLLELGGTVWGCHAGSTDDGIVQKSYEELVRHVEGTEAVITVENFAQQGTFVEDRVALLDGMDHPQIRMILDIGHVRDSGGENPMTQAGGPTETLRLCGHRLGHVHLHGFKNGKDHHPPLAEGDGIRWIELLRELRSIDYQGAINFEPAGEPVHSDSIEATGSFPEKIVEMAGDQP